MSHRNISGGNFRLKNANPAEIFFINTSTLVHSMFNFFSEKMLTICSTTTNHIDPNRWCYESWYALWVTVYIAHLSQ